MENFTCFSGSKLAMALIRPMQPTWNRSSGFSPRLSKRWMTESTSRRLPSMSFCRASVSPCRARRSSTSISTGDKTLSLDVFTPQISTFPCIETSKDTEIAAQALFRGIILSMPRKRKKIPAVPFGGFSQIFGGIRERVTKYDKAI